MMRNVSVLLSGLFLSAGVVLGGCDRTGPTMPEGVGSQGAAGAAGAHSPSAMSTQPGLPAGHPPIEGMSGVGNNDGQLGEPAPRGEVQRPSDSTRASFLGLEGPKPASWQWREPQNQMVAVNYEVPAPEDIEGGEAAFLNVYFFGAGMGGSVQDNIERWRGQFRADDGSQVTQQVEQIQVNGLDVTLVELAGQWRGFGARTFTPNQLFLAGIVEAPIGRVFIRLAGDERTIEANREAFMELMRGLRVADDAEVDDPGAPYAG